MKMSLLLLTLFVFSSLAIGQEKGIPIYTEPGIQIITSEIMLKPQIQKSAEIIELRNKFELEQPDRSNLPQAPGAIDAAQWPIVPDILKRENTAAAVSTAQTLGIQFTGATLADTGAFPPDTEGAVGPTQFFVFVNGRLRTFNKTTGTADGVINADPDVFFSSVMTPPTATNFTSDPNVRFDRLSNRWFMNIIDVPGGSGSLPNRVLIAVSDAASNGIISGSTVWTFYQFQGDATLFTDYESLGIDAEALYVGGNMFTTGGAYSGTKGFVIPKAPLLSGSPLIVWQFPNLATSTGSGPFSPRGVDNYDPTNTGSTAVGYFVGVDNAVFSQLSIRRVTDPGNTSTSPILSSNLNVTVTTTNYPNRVTHLGNTGGVNGGLDALDDRLFAAHLRNGRLWTAHNIRVSAAGVASTATQARNSVRWYELSLLSTGTPTLIQSGTIFDAATLLADARQYWIPSVMVSGQGHAAFGYSTAGTPYRIDAATSGKLVGDALGTTQSVQNYTASSTAYNPPSDPGGGNGRRWGDYSYTSLDPIDDMTMWTIQEYCNATNTYGVQAVKLIAPPPATPTSANLTNVPTAQSSVDVTITGTVVSGSGFYDPGTDPPGGTPFNHISASISGGVTVNSITYTDPTHVTLNISTVGATPGVQTVTITNPDGQSKSAAILTIDSPVSADIKVFLEGAYDDIANMMKTDLNTTPTQTLPLDDPYSQGESVTSIPSPDIVDWVLVQLRTETTLGDPSTATTVTAQRAAFLKNVGSIVDIDGVSPLYFAGVASGNYYLAVYHRNHLAVMSSSAQSFVQGSTTIYDFTDNQTKAYTSGPDPMAALTGEKFGMYAGDADGDGQVNAADRNETWNLRNQLGYLMQDVDLDAQVNAADRNITWNNRNLISFVP